MLKILLIIILVVFLVGALFLMMAVNYIVSIFRRFRQRINGENDYDSEEDNVRRRSNQYSFKRTTYSRGASDASGTQSQQYRQAQYSQGYEHTTHRTSSRQEPEIIVDTRDPSTVNRQIISDDEGEYVDFIEEK